MTVEVLLFARLRELCGQSSLRIDLEDGATVAECFALLAQRCPGLDGLRDGLVVAVNEVYADWDDCPASGDTVAFIPPVSGG